METLLYLGTPDLGVPQLDFSFRSSFMLFYRKAANCKIKIICDDL